MPSAAQPAAETRPLGLCGTCRVRLRTPKTLLAGRRQHARRRPPCMFDDVTYTAHVHEIRIVRKNRSASGRNATHGTAHVCNNGNDRTMSCRHTCLRASRGVQRGTIRMQESIRRCSVGVLTRVLRGGGCQRRVGGGIDKPRTPQFTSGRAEADHGALARAGTISSISSKRLMHPRWDAHLLQRLVGHGPWRVCLAGTALHAGSTLHREASSVHCH
jgi:hypothetical protein